MAVLIWLLLCSALVFGASRGWGVAAAVAGIFLIEWGYFAALEMASGGRTLGKMALGLRVVSAEGAQAGAGSLLLRNLLRDLDYLCGVPLMALDPLARRIGDRLAGTVVVHERPRAAAPRLGRVPAGWGAREVTVTERFLAGEKALADASLRLALARQLLDRIGRDAPELVAGTDPGDPVRALRQSLQVEGA